MDKNIKYKLQKNKSKILAVFGIVISLLLIGIIILSLNLFNNEMTEDTENTYLAEHIITASDGLVSLYDTESKDLVDKYDFKDDEALFKRNESLDYIQAYAGNSFYKISVNEDKIIKTELISDIKDVKFFLFDDNYIFFYDGVKYNFINLEEKSVTALNINNITNIALNNDYLLYTTDQSIYIVNLNNLEEKEIDIKADSYGVGVLGDCFFVANKFGQDNGKSTILMIEPKSSYIEKSACYQGSDLIIPSFKADETRIPIITEYNKDNEIQNNLYQFNLDEKKNIGKKYNLVQLNNKLDNKNTLISDGYLYTNCNKQIDIFDINGQLLYGSIIDSSEFFAPIFEN